MGIFEKIHLYLSLRASYGGSASDVLENLPPGMGLQVQG